MEAGPQDILAEMSISGLVNHGAIHPAPAIEKGLARENGGRMASHSRPWWSGGGRGRLCSTAVAAAYRGVLKSERCIVHRRRLREQTCRFLDGLRVPAPERGSAILTRLKTFTSCLDVEIGLNPRSG